MKSRNLALFPLAILFAGAPANAANFYWDADSVTAENQNGSGTWNTTNTNWESASTAGTDPQVVWANNSADTAFIGNASGTGYSNATVGGTITLGQNIVLSSLSMSSGQSGSYIIDPGAGPYTLTLGSIGNNNATANLTVNAVVAGTALSKLNAGKVILTGANTYTGATTVTAGTLAFSNAGNGGVASSLGKSSNVAANLLLANATTLQYTGGAATTDRLFTINGTAAGHAATLDASGAGAISFNNTGSIAYGTTAQTRTLNLAGINTGNNILGATIADNGVGSAVSVNKSGVGTWVLTGTANTYTGNTTISGGALDVGTINAGALSSSGLLFSGGVLQGNGSFTRAFSGVVTAGANTLSGLSGGFAAKGGALIVNFGGSVTPSLVQLSGGSFRFGTNLIFGSATADSKVTVVNPLDLNNSSRLITVNSGTGGDSAELSGIIRNDGALAASQVLTKAGAGTLTLSAANTYSSDTMVTGGTLALTNNLALQNSALDTSGGGFVNVTGSTTPTFGGLKGATNLASVVTTGYGSVTSLTLNPGTGATPTYTGVIGNGAAGMTLNKSGVGKQTLSGANTYSGTTTISAGTLALGASGTFASSPTIVVGDSGSSGAVLDLTAKSAGFALASTQTLKGIGTVLTNTGAGQLTNNGILAPGNSIGTLSVTGDYTFGSTSTYQVETSATSSDKIAISGAATIESGASITFSGTTGMGKYVLATAASGLGNPTFTGAAPAGYRLAYSATELDIIHKATLGTITATSAASSIITGGSTAIGFTVTNSAPTNSDSLSFSASAGANTSGIVVGPVSVVAQATSGSTSGLSFSGTAVGAAQSGSFNVTDAGATNSPQSGSVSVDVYDHAAPGAISGGSLVVKARPGYASPVVSTNSGSVSNGTGFRVNLKGSGTQTGGSTTGLSVSTISGISAGSSATITASLATGMTVGGINQDFSYTFADDSSLSGASASLSTQTVTVTGGVYDLAAADLTLVVGSSGTLTRSGSSYTLDFGSGLAANTDYTATIQLANSVFHNASYQDALDGSYTSSLGSAFLTNASDFTGLAAGGTNSFTITFNSGSAGTFNGSLDLAGISKQSGLSDELENVSIAFTGASISAVPEPDVAMLAGGLGVLSLLRRRRNS